jgi:hypothetical protein
VKLNASLQQTTLVTSLDKDGQFIHPFFRETRMRLASYTVIIQHRVPEADDNPHYYWCFTRAKSARYAVLHTIKEFKQAGMVLETAHIVGVTKKGVQEPILWDFHIPRDLVAFWENHKHMLKDEDATA